ncbi:MAG: FGGY family carbohydrate kinase, partial [Anaerolineaceae bacterium]|nr:FGGY family carbohydrate kinase [Anaerolineaceae bacterium]
MDKKIISYDLGTGGNKASLYDADGRCLANVFVGYDTLYPEVGLHEQKPVDWWNAVIESTRLLIEKSKVDVNTIVGLGISGHSLGAVPVDKSGTLLRETTPIWSDLRAQKEAEAFFKHVDADQWYLTTGNGFPAPLYTVFKIMWYRTHEPEMFRQIYKVIGTKDYINQKLTGRIATDYSYASGTGVYDLKAWQYNQEFIEASDLPLEIWPEILPSTAVLGEILPDAAKQLGLPSSVKVVCGGVDNSCMALGAKNTRDGRVYTSLGSAAWIAVSSEQPVLD